MQVPAAPLARPAAPAGAPNHPWQPCSVGLNRPAAATCPPLQLLATEPTLGLPGSPTSCPAASDHFDCLGDALEEQAKLLEELECVQAAAWPPPPPLLNTPPPARLLAHTLRRCSYQLSNLRPATCLTSLAHPAPMPRSFCPASPAAAVRAAVQPSPASALCAAGLDALHLDPATDEDDAAVQYAMAAAAAAAAEQRAAGSASADGAAVASGGGEPCTPQRHSGHDSSWNESPLGTSGLDYGEVQSPGACKREGLVAGRWGARCRHGVALRMGGGRVYALHASCMLHACTKLMDLCPASLLAAPLPLIAAAPAPAAARRPPLQMAIDNAQRVRLGHLPTPGAWRGCGRCVAPLSCLAMVETLQHELYAAALAASTLSKAGMQHDLLVLADALPASPPHTPPARLQERMVQPEADPLRRLQRHSGGAGPAGLPLPGAV